MACRNLLTAGTFGGPGVVSAVLLEKSPSRLVVYRGQPTVVEDQYCAVVCGRERLCGAMGDAGGNPLGVGSCAAPDLPAAADTDQLFAVRRYGEEVERRCVVQGREGGALISADLQPVWGGSDQLSRVVEDEAERQDFSDRRPGLTEIVGAEELRGVRGDPVEGVVLPGGKDVEVFLASERDGRPRSGAVVAPDDSEVGGAEFWGRGRSGMPGREESVTDGDEAHRVEVGGLDTGADLAIGCGRVDPVMGAQEVPVLCGVGHDRVNVADGGGVVVSGGGLGGCGAPGQHDAGRDRCRDRECRTASRSEGGQHGRLEGSHDGVRNRTLGEVRESRTPSTGIRELRGSPSWWRFLRFARR